MIMNIPLNSQNLREISREIVSGVIFSANSKILLGKKDPTQGGVYSDCWHIPGGGINDGEDKIAALKREIIEETNLQIDDARIELIDDKGRGAAEKTLKTTGEKVWYNMIFNVYSVRLTQNTADIKLQPSDDLTELKWIDANKLKDMRLTPPSVELFTRLGYI
jgi:8-oxo-dGTP pyrophosphatase MutT (NUDIX family)